jgi:hypothetical protein
MLGRILAFSGTRPNPRTRPIGSTRLGPNVQERLINPAQSCHLGPNWFNRPDPTTQVLCNTCIRAHLGISRVLRDMTHDIKLDRASEASSMSRHSQRIVHPRYAAVDPKYPCTRCHVFINYRFPYVQGIN